MNIMNRISDASEMIRLARPIPARSIIEEVRFSIGIAKQDGFASAGEMGMIESDFAKLEDNYEAKFGARV